MFLARITPLKDAVYPIAIKFLCWFWIQRFGDAQSLAWIKLLALCIVWATRLGEDCPLSRWNEFQRREDWLKGVSPNKSVEKELFCGVAAMPIYTFIFMLVDSTVALPYGYLQNDHSLLFSLGYCRSIG